MIKNANMFGAHEMLEKLRAGERLDIFDCAQIAEFGCYLSPPSPAFLGKRKASDELADAISPAVEKALPCPDLVDIMQAAGVVPPPELRNNVESKAKKIAKADIASLYFRTLQACDEILYNQQVFAGVALLKGDEPKEFSELVKKSLIINGLGRISKLQEMKYQAVAMVVGGSMLQKSDALTMHRAIVRDRADRLEAA